MSKQIYYHIRKTKIIINVIFNGTHSPFYVLRYTGWKEGKVLFNSTSNTFYLWFYGIGHMVKDHSERLRWNPLLPLHGLLFLICNKGSHHPTHRISHTTAFVTSVVKYWMERETAQWVYHKGLIDDHRTMSRRSIMEKSHWCQIHSYWTVINNS